MVSPGVTPAGNNSVLRTGILERWVGATARTSSAPIRVNRRSRFPAAEH